MELGLRGKVALVTGGSRGIGLACAIELAREGAEVCVVARDQALLDAAVARLTAMGVRAAAVVADLSTDAGCAAAVAGCEAALGPADVLINCAGAARQLPVLDLPVAMIEEALDLKLFGYLRLSQLVAPGMRARGWGRIVNIAGGAGTSPTAGNLPTSLANIGVLNVTRALSDALARDGVLVNVICPGVTDTDRARDLQAAAAAARGIEVDQAIAEAGDAPPRRAHRPPRGDRPRRHVPRLRGLLVRLRQRGLHGRRRPPRDPVAPVYSTLRDAPTNRGPWRPLEARRWSSALMPVQHPDWLHWIDGGGVTSPAGWRAGATYAGVKTYGDEPRFDLGILASDFPSAAAGVFTKNLVFGPAVALDRARVANGSGRAIVANSGCSNTVTGEQGELDARRMTALVAARLGVPEDEVFVASTGVIGRPLPMQLVEPGIEAVALSEDGGGDFARAIMTTDTYPKSRAARFSSMGGERTYTVGGVAKGSGMVHPDMATVFCFMTTDAPVDPAWLQSTLRAVADVSINMVDVDMDTSTSDTMLLLANGAAGGEPMTDAHPDAPRLRATIEAVAIELARDLARDGEGARTLIEVRACGAASLDDARRAARTVASSPLVKTMVTGRDANLGRVLAAVGRSGAALDTSKMAVWIGEHCAFEHGAPSSVDYAVLSQAMDAPEVVIRVDLGLGSAEAVAWGCDLTEGYVRINADYTT